MNPDSRTLGAVKHREILAISIAILHAEVSTIFLAISCYINNLRQDHVLAAACEAVESRFMRCFCGTVGVPCLLFYCKALAGNV